jgi:anti-sigma-K factor RskA
LTTTAKEALINVLPFDRSMAHSTISEELEELGAIFVLEALPLDERDGYLGHLQVCSVCRRLAMQFDEAAALLPKALADEQGSPELKRRILAQASRDMPAQVPPVSRPAVLNPAGIWRWLGRPWMTPVRIGAVAGLVLLVALAAWNINLQMRLNDQQGLLAGQSQLLSALAAGAKVSQLPGTQAAPQASATLVQVPRDKRALLIVRNLPRLTSDREYQIWRITGGIPVSAGTFAFGDAGEQLVTVSADLSSAEAIGVSSEPRGGSVVPRGPIVVLGAP